MKAIGLMLCLVSVWGHGFCCCMFDLHPEPAQSKMHSCCSQQMSDMAKDPSGHLFTAPCQCGSGYEQSLTLSLTAQMDSPQIPLVRGLTMGLVAIVHNPSLSGLPVFDEGSPPLWVTPTLEQLQILRI